MTTATPSKAHPPAHRGADKGITRVADEENIVEVFRALLSGAHPRAHRRTELPMKCRRRKRQKGKLGRDSEEELLEAAMALALEEEGEFLQAVPEGETMKVRQAEVYFRRHPKQLGNSCGTRAYCEHVLREQAAFRFSVLLVLRAAAFLFRAGLTFFCQ